MAAAISLELPKDRVEPSEPDLIETPCLFEGWVGFFRAFRCFIHIPAGTMLGPSYRCMAFFGVLGEVMPEVMAGHGRSCPGTTGHDPYYS